MREDKSARPADRDRAADTAREKARLRSKALRAQAGDIFEQSVSVQIERGHLAPEAGRTRAELSPRTWYRLPIAAGVSGDGSGYHIYIKSAPTEHLCVFFSGGGVAWNEFTAARPVTSARVAAGKPNYYWNNLRPFTQLMNINVGITQADSERNPFADWNFVVITYSTGDMHVGRSSMEYRTKDGEKHTLYFHGYENYRAAMLEAVRYFPAPDKLLIAGNSAGAFAVPALADEICSTFYPSVDDVTLLSDSGLLYNRHWKRIARSVWKSPRAVWAPINSANITLDWYRALHAKYGRRLRYLFASSTRDCLLSSYLSELTRREFRTDAAMQELYFSHLKEMTAALKALEPQFGIFINNWSNILTHGGTWHTAVREPIFNFKTVDGVTMADWLSDAVEGNVYDVGLRLLDLP